MRNTSEKAFDKRDKFADKYNYEFFNFCLCIKCAYYTISNTKTNTKWQGQNSCGNCKLLEAQGAFHGVMSTAVCNKFLSHFGSDINGKRARNLPDFVKLVKNEKGNISVVLTA